MGEVASASGGRFSEHNEAQRSNHFGAPSRKMFWVPQEATKSRMPQVRVSAPASVGASVFHTEVSTGHPHPVTRTMLNVHNGL